MKKYFIILVGILLLAAACQKQFANKQQNQEQPQTASTTQNNQNLSQGNKTGWETYTNSQYGFTIQYPKNNFALYTDASKIRPLTYIPVCNPEMVACLYYSKDNQKNTNLDGAGVSLDVLKDSGAEANCLMTREGEEKTGTVEINGAGFAVYKGGGAAAGHSEQYWNYRTFKNNACFQITLRTAEVNISNYDPSLDIKKYNWNEINSIQEQIFSTFKFTK
jgi:hypothetical protein